MGIDLNAIKSLDLLVNKDIKLVKIATLGRQSLWIKPFNIKDGLSRKTMKYRKDLEKLKSFEYAEDLFKIFGANSIESFDFSDYEGTTHIHDMNSPIGEEFKNRYDLVFDGGTLEHIFNFPIAIKNVMEMVKVGGYFLSITCCNNLAGHGFYQFSPELFFRIFNQENGFGETEVFISENKYFGNKCIWYKVKDPEEVKSRVMFWNSVATSIIVLSKKIENKEIFIKSPYQSDYMVLWNNKEKMNKRIKFPSVFNKIKRLFNYFFVKYDRKYFKKLK